MDVDPADGHGGLVAGGEGASVLQHHIHAIHVDAAGDVHLCGLVEVALGTQVCGELAGHVGDIEHVGDVGFRHRHVDPVEVEDGLEVVAFHVVFGVGMEAAAVGKLD